jgi:hypothetical protein
VSEIHHANARQLAQDCHFIGKVGDINILSLCRFRRNSKLTQVLRDSLGKQSLSDCSKEVCYFLVLQLRFLVVHHVVFIFTGCESKTLMLVHIRPNENDLCETVCTLGFATRVRSIRLESEESPVSLCSYH